MNNFYVSKYRPWREKQQDYDCDNINCYSSVNLPRNIGIVGMEVQDKTQR
jgi:hypothetical protein